MIFYMLLVLSSLVSPESASCYFHDETLPIPMYAHQGIFSAAKNAVYLFGGFSGTTADNRINLNKVYKWDLNDPSSWFVEIGETPNTGWFYSWIQNAVLVNGQVFFIGIEHNTRYTGKIFVYDLNTETFISEEKTLMPNPSWWGCLTTNSTHIFMVDGHDETTTQRLPIIQVYDVAADTWQSQVLDAGPPSTGGWYAQYCSLVGDSLYVLGGIIAGSYAYIDGIYRIDTRTLAIEQLTATLPSPQYGVSIYDGDHNLYLFGAYPTYTQDIVTFDLDTFSALTAFLSQQQFSGAPVLTINGSIYRFGGENNYVAFDEVEICDLPTDMPTQSPTKPPTNATNSPTSIPTATPSNLPTYVPSLIPTQSPTKTPTHAHAPSSIRIPTAIPSNAPTVSSLMPTRTDNFSNDSTMTPTNLSKTPSASLPSNDEYGVNVTIKLDAVLPQNETDELVSALREYAQNTANATNCSERINIGSEIEDDSKTLMKMWIITCCESTEKQLLVAFDATVLVYDIIGGIVAEAEVDEIEIEGIYADSTAQTVPADDVEKKRYWYLILLAVLLLLIAGVVVLWFVCRRKRKHHDERNDVDKFAIYRQQRAIRAATNEPAGHQANVHQDDDQANRSQPGAASFSRAEGDVPGAIGMNDHDGNLARVGLVDMSNEPITAEGDDDDNDDDEPILVLQQPQTVFIA